MNLHWKQLLVAVLAVLSGFALATPLLIAHIVLVVITVQGPKADLSLDPVYASFTVQTPNSDIGLPDWMTETGMAPPRRFCTTIVINTEVLVLIG
jgi:hypothetical protein